MTDAAEIPQTHARPEWLARPCVIAALWVATTILHIVDQLRFPDIENDAQYVSSVLFLASVPVLAAFVATAIARTRQAALMLCGTLLLIWFALSLIWLLVEFAAGGFPPWEDWAAVILGVIALVASGWAVLRILRGHAVSRRRRWASAAVALSTLTLWPALSLYDEQFARISAQFAAQEDAVDPPPAIDEERLWTAQPRLVDAALERLPAPSAAPEALVVAVGAGGSQDLFGREARTAGTVLARAFAAGPRTVILANDEASLSRAPLANTTNLGTVLDGIGQRADDRDLVVIYLTAHGSQGAELQTDLPDYTDLKAIGAKSLAAALTKAGIRRRIVIVSACYAGSWIKPLASDDTIVVTAARADRTSFGCSDDRELTFFGEALLKGPLASGASLSEGFEAARRTVAKWERQGDHVPSEPQAYVGRKMRDLWTARQEDR